MCVWVSYGSLENYSLYTQLFCIALFIDFSIYAIYSWTLGLCKCYTKEHCSTVILVSTLLHIYKLHQTVSQLATCSRLLKLVPQLSYATTLLYTLPISLSSSLIQLSGNLICATLTFLTLRHREDIRNFIKYTHINYNTNTIKLVIRRALCTDSSLSVCVCVCGMCVCGVCLHLTF